MKKITTLLFSLACFLTLGAWANDPTYVALIGETGYESLQAAIDAAQNGDTVKLVNDVNVSGLTVSGKAVIIEHNDKIVDVNPLKGTSIGPAIDAECTVKLGNWTNAIIIGDLKSCVELTANTEMNKGAIYTKYPFGGYISYFVGKSITLDSDLTLPVYNGTTGSIAFCGKNGEENGLILDLNGHTILQPLSNNGNGFTGLGAIAVNSGYLTIQDSSEDKTGKVIGCTNALIAWDNSNTEPGLEPSHLILKGGTISSLGGWTGSNVGSVVTIYSHFIMDGGMIINESSNINGKWTSLVYALGKTCVINDGVLEVNGYNCSYSLCGYYKTEVNGGDIGYYASFFTSPTINGGSFEGVFLACDVTISQKDVSIGYIDATNTAKLNITGGVYEEREIFLYDASTYEELDPVDLSDYVAEGYVITSEGENGLYAVVEAVASVVDGEGVSTLFATLKEAFAAANGKTVKLLKNQSLDVTKTDDSLKVPKGITMTLDLNGYTLASVATAATSSQLILNEGTLTIMDSSDTNKDGSGSGRIVVNAKPAWQYDGDPRHTGSYASNGILNKGTLTIESGYLTNATSGSAAYVVDNNSSGSTANLTINGGWLYQWFVAAVRQFANSTTYENNVTINGGIVEGYRFEWIQLPGSNASVAPKATLTVTGGELKSTQASGTQKVFYTYSYGNSRENSYITIEGGIWRGVLSFTEGVDTNNNAIKSTENIEITGGYFTEDIYTFAWWYGDDEAQAKKFIKGGCFAKHPNSSYYRFGVCPGYGVYDNEDPETMVEFPYEVREIPVVELTVTENEIPIKVQEDVLSEIVGDDVFEGLESEDPEVRAEAEQAVIEKLHEKETNGLEVWQNYVLGLDGATEDLGVTTEDTSSSKIEIVPSADPMPNSGFTVSYKMDYTDAEETTTTLDTLDIELEGEKDPTGVYQVKALLTPENGGDPIVVETKNKVGVVKAIQPMELAIVSVPWKKLSLAAHSEDIPVADLVKTTTLDQGDMLLDYNGENYDAWALTAEKTWESVGKVIKTENGMELVASPDPTKTTVKRGSGVFLKRQDHKKPYYLYGQVDDSEVVETLPEKVNLVANPNVTDFDLNAEGAIKASADDTILIPTARAPKKCTMKGGKWGYMTHYVDQLGIVREKRVEEVKIPAGTGFWYEKGSSGGSSEINWSK
ncbi:MAG: carbohydrate-binding domain-containing protein [Kiritimatiellae bacterium]|nr:carbohydrate-binding domain-containing protein [Kiritimatiellia bacterium]